MSAEYEIFVRPRMAGTELNLLDDLTRIAHAEFTPVKPDQEDWYIARPERGAIEVDFHTDFLDDRDIPFSTHPICITVHKPREGTLQDAEMFSQEIYGELVRTDRYDCFLVFNMERLLAIHQR
ncbi:hypothetical protein [Gandjariella thermophila]|uniref:Uncharacterized protein n=1 Tax=Gandjariella thermophila TaxID=1931992 RepID=A0A4D4J0Y2_9PSEU|nr:hypothetical protein [Gandjariella thermophila]GDY30285.1 hypothetical protein GTS_19180 [Gandjariella thermophila]